MENEEKTLWEMFVEQGVDQLLGITKDEFEVIIKLSLEGHEDEDIEAFLEAYRAYKNYRNDSENQL